MGQKYRTSITIRPETRKRILLFAEENHLTGGLSGALEFIAWHVLQVDEHEHESVDSSCSAGLAGLVVSEGVEVSDG